jgi:hypothetical protein
MILIEQQHHHSTAAAEIQGKMLADFAVFENFVEEAGEGAGAGTHSDLGEREAAGEVFVSLAKGLELVGDVEGGEDGYAE